VPSSDTIINACHPLRIKAGQRFAAYLCLFRDRLQAALAARPSDKPQLTDFRREEVALPTPSTRQVLLGVQYLSLDPYMRGRMDDRKSYAKPLQIGDVMVAEAVAHVITNVTSSSLTPDDERTHFPMAQACISLIQEDRRSRRQLGVLGMPGLRLIPACASSANPSPAKPWWSRRRAERSIAGGPTGEDGGRERSASPADSRNVLREK
jgi:hypothetical protein